MSKRLDSITRPANTSGTPTPAKPALKFKPKAVSRKSKEERENASKINTPGINKIAEKNSKKLAKKGPANLSARNKKLNGTQLVISGPLSEGTISLGGQSSSSSSNPNRNPTNPLLERLKNKATLNKERKLKLKKEDGEFNGFYGDESDSDIDDNAIDMGKKMNNGNDKDVDGDINLDEMDTDLFPIRAERNEHREYGEESKTDNTIKTEFHNAASIIPSEPNTRENTVVSRSISPEPINTTGASSGLNEDDENVNINDYQEQQEQNQAKQDFNKLSKSLKNLDMKSENKGLENMFFLQLPCSLPILENDKNGVIGKIRVHKSGKMTLKMGQVKFEILRGGSSDFIQDVVLVDPINGACYHVGNIKDKITAIPKIM